MSKPPENHVCVSELERFLKEDSTVTLIDARTSEEYDEAHVPGAINVPIADLADFAKDRGKSNDEVVVTMCGSSGRGAKAATILDSLGIRNVRILEGGLKAWREAGLPIA